MTGHYQGMVGLQKIQVSTLTIESILFSILVTSRPRLPRFTCDRRIHGPRKKRKAISDMTFQKPKIPPREGYVIEPTPAPAKLHIVTIQMSAGECNYVARWFRDELNEFVTYYITVPTILITTLIANIIIAAQNEHRHEMENEIRHKSGGIQTVIETKLQEKKTEKTNEIASQVKTLLERLDNYLKTDEPIMKKHKSLQYIYEIMFPKFLRNLTFP
jgi:hypothetical protein